MARFTVILGFGGKTYLRQVKATSAHAALKSIAAGKHGKAALFRALAKDTPAAIDGIENCWCCSAEYRGDLALVNIVKTAE